MIRTSAVIASLIYASQRRLPSLGELLEESKEGIYIGDSNGTPVWLDFDKLLNPHIFVAGVTGSGKTYFMKNLMLRLGLILGAEVSCFDFTGEYNEQAKELANGDYIDLSGSDEKKKIRLADERLGKIIEEMRRKGIRKGARKFVILDEAWKMLKSSNSFEVLLREGRKYGVGLVMASQLVEDLSFPLLGNIASIFLLRMQNKEMLEAIAKSYMIDAELISKAEQLNQGSALLLQSYKTNKTRVFEIDRLLELRLSALVKLKGVKMEIEISTQRLEALLYRIYGEKAREAIARIERERSIGLASLIRLLLGIEPDKLKALKAVRDMGVSDEDAADAFAEARQGVSAKQD